MHVDILIKHCTAITMDEQRRVIENAQIAIKNDQIVYVGPMTEAVNIESEKIINGQNHIALPGLIDTHAHAGHGLTKSLGEGGVEEGWDMLMEHIYYRSTSTDFWYAEALLSGLERLMFGVTTGVSMMGSAPRYDDMRYPEAHVQGMREIGVRDVVGVGTPNPPYPKRFRHWDNGQPTPEVSMSQEPSFDTTYQTVKKFNRTYHDLTFAYPSPSAIGYREGLTHAEMKAQASAMKAIATEFGTPIHGHSFAGDIKYAYEHLDILGPQVFTAHVTGVSDEEIKILADTGTNVCSGPSTNAYIRSRCPVVEMMQAGVNVTFCTDASAPDRNYDLLPKLRVGYRLQQSYFNNSDLLPPGKVLEMITVDAAKAIGLESMIGSLEVGKKADVIMINLNRPHLYPIWMAPLRVVHQASGQDIDTVIVNGVLKVENYQPVDLDVQRILNFAQNEAEKMIQRAGAEKALQLPKRFWKHVSY